MNAPASSRGSAPAAPRTTDRFFAAILIGLALLLVVAAISVTIARQPAPALPAESPGGIVQEFFARLERGDYSRAYALLSDQMPRKPTLEDFTRMTAAVRNPDQPQRVRIDGVDASGDTATVRVAVTRYFVNSGPFGGSSEYTETETFTLRQEAAGWRITGLPYGYGIYPR